MTIKVLIIIRLFALSSKGLIYIFDAKFLNILDLPHIGFSFASIILHH
ncbi:MAG: hypothetical protein WCS63_03235 [Bacteroidales bacterium]|nr:hypothetical protein [Bacteroidota bacterium]